MMQASRFECLPFDPFSLFQNGLVTSEVDIGWCGVVQVSDVSADGPGIAQVAG
ncbi:MAG: hypothetical protein HRT60_14670 [Dinoroseobacter sp.]|nr:hypothetical protein [Dinoroseobacter sp.]